MNKTEKTFGSATEALCKAGYPAGDLLPLIPPGAIIDHRVRVEPKMLGKIPGRFIAGGDHESGGGTWVPLRLWQEGLSETDQATARNWPTENVGLLAAKYPGLDVDVNSAEARDLVMRVAAVQLDCTGPMRTRGGAPRCLIPFRLQGEPFGKLRLEFRDTSGEDHAVELLASGQQYVVAGVHPSGVPYHWSRGGLAGHAPMELPPLSKTNAQAFFEKLVEAIEAQGWKVGKHSTQRPVGDRPAVSLTDIEPPYPPEVALAALNCMPNTIENFPSRDDLVTVTAEFKAATGRYAEEYRVDFLQWCEDGDFAGQCDFEAIWDSMPTVHVRPTALYQRARTYGFTGDALADFTGEVPAVPVTVGKRPKWLMGEETDSKSKGPTNLDAVVKKLAETSEWQGVFGFDEFAQRVMVLDHLPNPDWPDHRPNEPFKSRPLSDGDITQTRLWMQRHGGMPSAKPGDVEEAIGWRAKCNTFHPVRDYFGRIKWDGVPRLNTWLADYLGAKADVSPEREAHYLAEVGRKVLISAVARIFTPGCKVDTVLVLEGEQGLGKSSVVLLLVPSGDWHSETPPELGTKDAALHLLGKWIIELSELASVGRASVEHVKSFVSTAVDKFRRPYGRLDESFHRQCIFIGTTNASEFLRDDTGGRRFLPVKMTKPLDREAFAAVRDQLWAEAKAAYWAEEPWHITGEALDAAKEAQFAKAETDPWDEPILARAEELAAERKQPPTIPYLLSKALGVYPASQTQLDQRRVAGCLRRTGWRPLRQRINGKPLRIWWNSAFGDPPVKEWEAEELRKKAEQ